MSETSADTQTLTWAEGDDSFSARWQSEAGAPPPKRVVIADDTMNADTAFRMASEGTAMLYRGDFQNAKLLLQAIARRVDRKPRKLAKDAREAFNQHRMAQAQRARTLGAILIPFNADHTIPLRRAPDVQQACTQAYGKVSEPYVATLRELLGLIGSSEWRKKGVEIPALGARIFPHYGVFSPVRGEYIELVAKAPIPKDCKTAFDIGTGTGVLAAVLARRGVERIVATDQDPRALECARENIEHLFLTGRVEVVEANLFPQGRAQLIVCNPPWVPARPSSPLEHAVYDPDSRMLKAFLAGLADHLDKKGEGWLILSDFAEQLGLRTRDELLGWIDAAGLKVVERLNARPKHPKASDENDPLYQARKKEMTTLWRLAVK